MCEAVSPVAAEIAAPKVGLPSKWIWNTIYEPNSWQSHEWKRRPQILAAQIFGSQTNVYIYIYISIYLHIYIYMYTYIHK